VAGTVSCQRDQLHKCRASTTIFFPPSSSTTRTAGRCSTTWCRVIRRARRSIPSTAHTAAMELAKYFDDYEVLVCTHVDREHVHSHFHHQQRHLWRTGKKLHMSEGTNTRAACGATMRSVMQFGLPVFQKGQRQKKVKPMSIAEYHIAAEGRELEVPAHEHHRRVHEVRRTREEFIALMKSEGYGVRWEDTRQEHHLHHPVRHEMPRRPSAR
jgi:hypothetical protein